MKRLFGLLLSVLLADGLTAASPLDSLRRLPGLPLAAQLRLARQPVTLRTAPTVVALTRRPGLPRLVRAELLANLAGHYLHENQPSLAIIQMLQTRRMGLEDGDSLRAAVACEWLSYSYYLLKQPQPGIAYGREALRLVPRHTAAGRAELGGIYTNLACCATIARDFPLATHCYRQALRLARQERDPGNVAVGLANLADLALQQQQYPRAAALLDSAFAAYAPPRHIGTQLFLDEMRGVLDYRLGHYAAAARRLEATLHAARAAHNLNDEMSVTTTLVPALQRLGQYQRALTYQRRYAVLQDSLFEESSARHARELQTLHATQQKEQQLARQQQRIAALQAATRLREAELTRRTTLFLAVLAGAGLMLVLVVVRQRARHLLASTTAALRMRTRIAADLHDEVGTLLTRVNLQAELLRQQQPQPDPALERLLTNSRQAASTMRDIVWGIDAEADTVGALLDRMRDHLDQCAPPAGLATELHVLGLRDEEHLNPELRQHLYLIFKEAVSNAARHARQATELHVSLERTDGNLRLRVADDGQAGGAAPSGRSGLGLRSMQQRATALGGTLRTGPAPGHGFLVELLVPQ
ncbi:histidine kinase [Hymenobacter sp. 15J16-1T3B]|uniref:sensor histidine kinase n=1 Tax=Hymenobacter sp. 15J16-1T3B TaxID=2886941 RepID=UPI001D1004C3|nr:sensor histidine kinase [Hymenobacter sp. 15J16-1T3B]MCC3160252.1 histidine kinase [Hymenobacter sp. 15J16-1T3B]